MNEESGIEFDEEQDLAKQEAADAIDDDLADFIVHDENEPPLKHYHHFEDDEIEEEQQLKQQAALAGAQLEEEKKKFEGIKGRIVDAVAGLGQTIQLPNSKKTFEAGEECATHIRDLCECTTADASRQVWKWLFDMNLFHHTLMLMLASYSPTKDPICVDVCTFF